MNLSHKTVIRIILPVCCIVFSGCDFLEDKFVTMMTRLEKKLDESAGNTISGKALTNSVHVESVQCDILPPPELLNLEILAESCVTNGMPEKEVLAALGTAKGVALVSGRRFLVYDGGQVDVTGGFVTNLPAGFIADVQAAREKSAQWKAFEAQQKRRGLVRCDGAWVTPEERSQLVAKKAQQAVRLRQLEQEKIRNKDTWDRMSQSAADYDRNGVPIDYSELISEGEITVVEFYLKNAPNMGPSLEELARNDRDIVVKRIDIMKWESLIARRYNVRSLPKVLVFDRKGRLVSPPECSFPSVNENVKTAKSRKY